MRRLILLVTCQVRRSCVTGCKKRDQVEPTTPVRVVEPIPSISPRAQFKRTTNPGEKPRGPIVRNLLLRPMGNAWRWFSPSMWTERGLWSIDGEPRKLSDIDGLVNLLLPDGKQRSARTRITATVSSWSLQRAKNLRPRSPRQLLVRIRGYGDCPTHQPFIRTAPSHSNSPCSIRAAEEARDS